VIRGFKHKGLQQLFETGKSSKVRADLQARALRRLDALDHAESLADLGLPGYGFHGLRGKPKRYALHVNGPWRITFEWKNGEASNVIIEQYH